MITATNLVVRAGLGNSLPATVAVAEGDWLVVIGGAGSGKTGLALAVCGVSNQPVVSGSIDFGGGDRPDAGYVPTRPDLAFSGIADSVVDEVALFVPMNRDHRSAAIRALDICGAGHLSDRSPDALSGGERAKVAIAAALAQDPQILLIDQAIEWIDVTSRPMIYEALSGLSKSGLMVIETRSDRWATDSGRERRLHLASDRPTPSHVSVGEDAYPKRACRVEAKVSKASYGKGQFGLRPFEFLAESGDRVAVLGANGSGKTTFLRSLALLLPDHEGSIVVRSSASPVKSATSASVLGGEHEWARECLYCFQEPDDQLFCPTVEDELAYTARTARTTSPIDLRGVAVRFGIEHLLTHSPLSLPRGIRRAVLLASAFVANPPVLLLDEPTAELGQFEADALIAEMRSFSAAGGICLFISHDMPFVERVTTKTVTLKDGIIA